MAVDGIVWTTVEKRTALPDMKIEMLRSGWRKEWVEKGEQLGVGKRTLYTLQQYSRTHWSLGIVSDDKHGIIYPGGFKTESSARAGAEHYERTGKTPKNDYSDRGEVPRSGLTAATWQRTEHERRPIAWVPKKHPSILWVGRDELANRWSVERQLALNSKGTKTSSHEYRWRGTGKLLGNKLSGWFSTLDEAKGDANDFAAVLSGDKSVDVPKSKPKRRNA